MRPYFVALMAAGFISYMVIYLTRGLDWWSFAAGVSATAFVSTALWVRDEPPEFIAKWRRGAEGEKKTSRALARLMREGWKVRHDVQLAHSNADHVLLSPTGVGYVVETKTLAGQVTLERGVLVRRFVDDPAEVRRVDLRPQVRRVLEEIDAKWKASTGRPAPPLYPIVVIWGSYTETVAVSDGIAYVSGNRLVEYLRARQGTTRERSYGRLHAAKHTTTDDTHAIQNV